MLAITGLPSDECVTESGSATKEAAMQTQFTTDQLGAIQLFDVAVLAAAVRGELDLNELARKELACRGLNEHGEWVGF